MSVIFKELCKFAVLDFWGREFILGQADGYKYAPRNREGRHTLRRDGPIYDLPYTMWWKHGKTLFALHKLVGLRHAIIEFSTAIHVDTRLNGLIQALHERADGLQEREVCIGLGNAHIVRRVRA